MVAGAVTALILACTATLFVLGSRYHRQLQTTLEVQQDCLLGAEAVVRELAESNAATFRWDAAPAGVVFASPRSPTGQITLDAGGAVLWRKWVCFYIEPIGGVPTLVRKEELLGSPTATPPAPGSSKTSVYFQALAGPRRAVAANFQSLWAGPGSEVHFLAARRDVKGDYRFQLDTQVNPRN